MGSFALFVASLALLMGREGARAQFVDGGAISMDCEDCGCTGSSDDGSIDVFNNPSTGGRVSDVSHLETRFGLMMRTYFKLTGTLRLGYYNSSQELIDRPRPIGTMVLACDLFGAVFCANLVIASVVSFRVICIRYFLREAVSIVLQSFALQTCVTQLRRVLDGFAPAN